MFLKMSEHLEKTQPLKRTYKGIVVSNNDPKKYGRIKVNIVGLIEGTADTLPWCSPNNPTFLGGSTNALMLVVPEVNSEVEVTFPHESPYLPFYDGHWQSAKAHTSDFDANYPNSYGFKDSIGNIFRINKTLKEFFLKIVEKITINADKDILIESTGGNFKAKGTAEAAMEADLIKLGVGASLHAAIAENIVAYNDAHVHPAPQAPTGIIPTQPPIVKMADKAGSVMDVNALSILIKGNG